jgi:hypothetical protein
MAILKERKKTKGKGEVLTFAITSPVFLTLLLVIPGSQLEFQEPSIPGQLENHLISKEELIKCKGRTRCQSQAA